MIYEETRMKESKRRKWKEMDREEEGAGLSEVRKEGVALIWIWGRLVERRESWSLLSLTWNSSLRERPASDIGCLWSHCRQYFWGVHSESEERRERARSWGVLKKVKGVSKISFCQRKVSLKQRGVVCSKGREWEQNEEGRKQISLCVDRCTAFDFLSFRAHNTEKHVLKIHFAHWRQLLCSDEGEWVSFDFIGLWHRPRWALKTACKKPTTWPCYQVPDQ